jgi:mitochondrial fission protein ELM1
MKSLAIVVFFDGRLGHEKQTTGILQALADITPVEVISEKIVDPSALHTLKNWTDYLLSSRLSSREKDDQRLDLIIGTGTHTHIPMLLLKKEYCSTGSSDPRVVTCMTPELSLLNKLDLCCIPQHDEPALKQNVFETIGPPNTVKFSGRHDADKGLIMVGGEDPKSHTWDSRTIAAKISNIINSEPEKIWTVTSSPRTPAETCHILEEMADSLPTVSFYRSTSTPAGWVEEQYAANLTVWVTADSMSMIYEALTAGCSVGILPVQWKKTANKFQRSIDYLAAKKMVVEYENWLAGDKAETAGMQPLNESRRCAEEILRRWWPERLTKVIQKGV